MSLFNGIRPELLDMEPYKPGLTVEEIKARYGLSRVIKLAGNENPLGVSARVLEALTQSLPSAHQYPQNGSPRLKAALARELDVDPARLVVGCGSDELIDLIVRVKARPGLDHVLAHEKCFSVYGAVCLLSGVEYRQIPRDEGYGVPVAALAEAADEHTAVVFVTSPDNPTGDAPSADELSVLAGALPTSTLLVVDEAYIDFAWPPEQYSLLAFLDNLPNVAIIRTMSKAYGLAGLRVGYAVLPPDLARAVEAVRIPFTVNRPAEDAALAALEDKDFSLSTLDVVLKGRTFLTQALTRLGCEPLPSQGNFIMFKPTRPVPLVFEELLQRGVIVRPLASFGFPEHIRVTVGTQEDNALFLAALEEALAHA